MENEIAKKKSGGKIAFIILISIVAALIVYYSVMMMKSPVRKLEEIKKEFAAKSHEKSDIDQKIIKDSAYLKLLKERAFLQSKVVLAETDSIYLTINLADSIVNVEISGVVIRKTKINKLQISKILMNKKEGSLLSVLASPLTISHAFATIKKEPLMLKVAPKDTSEYKPDIMPDTTKTEPVNYILEMNNGIRIYVYQTENVKPEDRISQFRFDLADRVRDTWNDLKNIAVMKVPDYHPFIKMYLPRADAKIIYRAVPRNGQIAISGW